MISFLQDGRLSEISLIEGRVGEILHRDEANKLIKRDSFSHHPDGVLNQQFVYQDGRISRSMKYQFDQDGLLLSIEHTRNNEVYLTQKLYWMDGNLSVLEEYFTEYEKLGLPNGLSFEYHYEYDNHRNPLQNIPGSSAVHLQWSDNNVVRSVLTDYVGILDVHCSDCRYEYTYNQMGLPFEVENKTETGFVYLTLYE